MSYLIVLLFNGLAECARFGGTSARRSGSTERARSVSDRRRRGIVRSTGQGQSVAKYMRSVAARFWVSGVTVGG